MNDPHQNFYDKGYSDAKTGKNSRVTRNYKLSYVSGRHDALRGAPNRYAEPQKYIGFQKGNENGK